MSNPTSATRIFDELPSEPGDAAGLTVRSAGVAAARAFATDIAGWERHDDEELEILLFSLGAFIEKAGTGGGLF